MHRQANNQSPLPVLDYARPGVKGTLRRLTGFREFMIIAIILVASTGMSFASPFFLTPENLLSVLLSVSTESIIAIGMTILLVSGGFDLSVGSTAAMAGMITALCLSHEWSVGLAVPAGLATGVVIGLINGLIIAKVGINAFITTLATMSIVRSLVMVVAGGKNITTNHALFKAIGQDSLLGIQYPILIAVALMVAGDLLLRKSRFFRQNYYIGGNEKAAILSGIAVDQVKIFNYALTGFLAALAGIVMTARFASASVTAAQGLELKVISAVIIGGASLQGGEGTILGAFLGATLMAIIVTSLNLLGVAPYWQGAVIGSTLLGAVVIDTLTKKRL